MSLASDVQKAVHNGCITKRIQEQSCRLRRDDISDDSVTIDLRKPTGPANSGVPHCDFIFFGRLSPDNGEWIAPIELKRGEIRAGQAKRQLQGGADVAHEIVSIQAEFEFKAVVASGHMDKFERLALHRNESKVRFRGKSYAIERVNCGSKLAEVLKT